MPYADDGAQRASRDLSIGPTMGTPAGPDAQPAPRRGAIDLRSRPAPTAQARPARRGSRSSWSSRAALIPAIAMIAALGGTAGNPTLAGASTLKPKAVFIVGPVSGETARYISIANGLAASAERSGMDVRRIYSPNATWSAVLSAIQGAKLVVDLGHGNGWPSPYPPYQTNTKNGFGLNASSGNGDSNVKYYGEGPISRDVDLAPNAIVLLSHLCYSAGNGEPWQAIPSESAARQRVDGFAAGFLKAGARAVFAYDWSQREDFVKLLFSREDDTMDQIFQVRGNGDWDGYVGGRDIRFGSVRSPGNSVHMDRSDYGYLRSVVGDLSMTTKAWRGEQATLVGSGAPQLTSLSTSRSLAVFSPNGDHIDDTLRLYHTVSGPAWLDATISRSDGSVVGRYKVWSSGGSTTSQWNGRDGAGKAIPDGTYHLSMRPRDKAGKQGSPRTVQVRVLTALKSPRVSSLAIFVTDEDRLAASTTLRTTLTEPAKLSYLITDMAGKKVVGAGGASQPTGSHSWSWSGTDREGRYVPTGYYRATVTATTSVGSASHVETVFVGPFKILVADTTPARGQSVVVTIISTEPLSRRPLVTVGQPGEDEYTSTTTARGGGRYVTIIRVHAHGSRGRGWIKVNAFDANGQAHVRTIGVAFH